MTPRALFLDLVPALGAGRARAFPALAAKICVVVEHEAFTLDLHAPEGDAARPRARAGGDPAAPFQLYLTRPVLDALVAGGLDVDAAIAQGHVGYRGDLRVLQQLGRLLTGAASAVDVRSAR